jgi:hypothetical protein
MTVTKVASPGKKSAPRRLSHIVTPLADVLDMQWLSQAQPGHDLQSYHRVHARRRLQWQVEKRRITGSKVNEQEDKKTEAQEQGDGVVIFFQPARRCGSPAMCPIAVPAPRSPASIKNGERRCRVTEPKDLARVCYSASWMSSI